MVSQKVIIIAHPSNSPTVQSQVTDLVKLMCTLCLKVYVTGNRTFNVGNYPNLTYIRLTGNDSTNDFIIKKIAKYTILNFQLLLNLLINIKNIDTVIFYDLYGVSLFLSKLLAKKTIVLIMGDYEQSIKHTYTHALGDLLTSFFRIKFNFVKIFADILVSDSEKHLFKIRSGNAIVAQYRFIDADNYRINTPISDRTFCVGYIGRFSEEKGFRNLLISIPKLLSMDPKIQLMLIGDGLLRSEVQKYVHPEMQNRVHMKGWVTPPMIPFYLNKMRLIVVPSYTEGLPHIIIEAMACGTPVLSTPVGDIPHVIRDSDTGFLLENNSPTTIANTVIFALNYEDLEKVTTNARNFIEANFTFNAIIKAWEKILT